MEIPESEVFPARENPDQAEESAALLPDDEGNHPLKVEEDEPEE